MTLNHRFFVGCFLALAAYFVSHEEVLADSSKPRVLIIQSYHDGYDWQANYRRALEDRLGDTAELEFFALDSKRTQEPQYRARADQAWQHFQQHAFALVILADDNALRLLGGRFAGLPTPVVYLGINNNPRNYLEGRPANITGILERPLLRRSILHIHQLLDQQPRRVLVLFDHGTTAQTLLEEEFQGRQQRRFGPVSVDIRLIDRYDRWQQTLLSAQTEGYDAVVVGLYHTLLDANGIHVPDQQVIRWSSAQSPVPLFGFWKFAVGPQMTIGGLVLDGYAQGAQAAELGARILAGAPPPLLPLSSGEGRFVFSRTQLQRWQLELPAAIVEQAEILP